MAPSVQGTKRCVEGSPVPRSAKRLKASEDWAFPLEALPTELVLEVLGQADLPSRLACEAVSRRLNALVHLSFSQRPLLDVELPPLRQARRDVRDRLAPPLLARLGHKPLLRRPSGLRGLSLRGWREPAAGLGLLQAALGRGELSLLRRLDLEHPAPDSLRLLADLPALSDLTIRADFFPDNQASPFHAYRFHQLAAFLASAPRLERLELWADPVGRPRKDPRDALWSQRGLSRLFPLLPASLRHLAFRGFRLARLGWEAETRLPLLESLDLRDNEGMFVEVGALGGSLPRLHTLHLGGAALTSHERIAAFPSLRRLSTADAHDRALLAPHTPARVTLQHS